MYIADHLMAHVAADALDALTDNGRAQMAHMKGLCHIRSAVVDYDGLWLLCLFHGKLFLCLHLKQVICQKASGYFHIDKTGIYSTHFFKNRIILQLGCHILSDHNRRLLVHFLCCHSAVTLVFTQVRPVGDPRPSVACVVTA